MACLAYRLPLCCKILPLTAYRLFPRTGGFRTTLPQRECEPLFYALSCSGMLCFAFSCSAVTRHSPDSLVLFLRSCFCFGLRFCLYLRWFHSCPRRPRRKQHICSPPTASCKPQAACRKLCLPRTARAYRILGLPQAVSLKIKQPCRTR